MTDNEVTEAQQQPEKIMSKIVKQYANPNNGGQERMTRDGDKYYINSNWGDGFSGNVQVSRSQMEMCLRHTSAPDDVVAAILAD